jgi:hypothetical protein
VVEAGIDGEPYLFSSLVHYREGEFLGEPQPDSLELPFAKVLLAALARGRGFDSRTRAWEGPLGNERMEHAKIAAARMLGGILSEARTLMAQMMPDFGSHDDDLFYVNMCLPVDDLQDQRTRAVFQDVVESAWKHANPQQRDDSSSQMCFLYPEVAANVQAFLKSGFAHSEWGNPFFMTDVGAGTVDQSYFIPTLGLQSLTFLSGLVESLGSSQIEKRCADLLAHDGQAQHLATMETIRAFKEGRGVVGNEARTVFSQVVNELQHGMVGITGHTVSQGRSRLGEVGQEIQNQFGRTRILFAGGGILDVPYRAGVRNVFQQIMGFAPDTIELPRPNDLLRASGAQVPDVWFRRLTVAYGLSYMREDLQRITLPNQLGNLPPAAHQLLPIGGCQACGRPTVFGDDFCYSHGR